MCCGVCCESASVTCMTLTRFECRNATRSRICARCKGVSPVGGGGGPPGNNSPGKIGNDLGRTAGRNGGRHRAVRVVRTLPGQLDDAFFELLGTAVHQQAAADQNLVADLQDVHLHRMAVDAGPIGAVQVGQNNVIVVDLNLRVIPADALVIEANVVFVLPADGDGRGQIGKDLSPFESVDDLKRDVCHEPIE